MRRLPVWLVCAGLLLMGATPTFGVESGLPADTPGAATETTGLVVVIPGLEAVAALAGASTGAAMATIVVDQRVVGNRVEEQNIGHSTLLESSGRDNLGIVNINQDAGNINNQANVTVLSVSQGGTNVGSGVHGLDVAATAVRTDNTVITGGGHHENRIASSFAGTVGLVNANQSVGNLNSQVNVVALSLGALAVPDLALLADSALGAVTVRNSVIQDGPGGSRVDIVTDSFAGYRGVALVSQVSGDLNVVRNIATISLYLGTDVLAFTSTAGIGR